MKIKRNIRTTSEMNLASSSDIAFLLIIFFMVTSAFIFKDGLHLVLPDKNKKPQVVEDKEITTVIIKNEDTLLFNKKAATKDELEQNLRDLIKKDPEAIVLLKIGKEVKYQRVIDIVDIIKIMDVQKLSLRIIKEG
ncbi:MAG: biopolymer transporter ExbD [Spirochaetes bacterium]|nr:biopolymer transporter ExbD [Spirochaetota bacterium]